MDYNNAFMSSSIRLGGSSCAAANLHYASMMPYESQFSNLSPTQPLDESSWPQGLPPFQAEPLPVSYSLPSMAHNNVSLFVSPVSRMAPRLTGGSTTPSPPFLSRGLRTPSAALQGSYDPFTQAPSPLPPSPFRSLRGVHASPAAAAAALDGRHLNTNNIPREFIERVAALLLAQASSTSSSSSATSLFSSTQAHHQPQLAQPVASQQPSQTQPNVNANVNANRIKNVFDQLSQLSQSDLSLFPSVNTNGSATIPNPLLRRGSNASIDCKQAQLQALTEGGFNSLPSSTLRERQASAALDLPCPGCQTVFASTSSSEDAEFVQHTSGCFRKRQLEPVANADDDEGKAKRICVTASSTKELFTRDMRRLRHVLPRVSTQRRSQLASSFKKLAQLAELGAKQEEQGFMMMEDDDATTVEPLRLNQTDQQLLAITLSPHPRCQQLAADALSQCRASPVPACPLPVAPPAVDPTSLLVTSSTSTATSGLNGMMMVSPTIPQANFYNLPTSPYDFSSSSSSMMLPLPQLPTTFAAQAEPDSMNIDCYFEELDVPAMDSLHASTPFDLLQPLDASLAL